MTSPSRTVVLAAVLLVAGGCRRVEAPAQEGAEPAAPADTVGFTDPAVPIRAAAGTEFEIVLEANATTGYQWALADSLPSAVVQRLSSEYEAPATPAGVAGAGGRERWRFRAVGAGQAAIPLVLRRSWEADAPADSARFQVVVR